MKYMGFLTMIAMAITFWSCEGTEETTEVVDDTSPLKEIKDEAKLIDNAILDGAIPFHPDSCGKESANDFDNFLRIPYGTSESALDSILGKGNGGEYTTDSLSFVYYYKMAERVPITVWANTKTTQIEMIYMEVVSYIQYFESDFENAKETYNMLECDYQWFGKSQEDIIEIMGEPRKTDKTEDAEGKEIVNLFYDSDDYRIAVNFKFFESQDYYCSSVMVNWFY